jgi:hypothetical protein
MFHRSVEASKAFGDVLRAPGCQYFHDTARALKSTPITRGFVANLNMRICTTGDSLYIVVRR